MCLNGSDKSRLIDGNSYFHAMADWFIHLYIQQFLISTHSLLGPKFSLWEYVDNSEQRNHLTLPVPHPLPVYSPEERLACQGIDIAKCDNCSDEIPGNGDLDELS